MSTAITPSVGSAHAASEPQLVPVTGTGSGVPSRADFQSALQPCLVLLFQFFTVEENLVRQGVSHAWMEIARLPRYWSTYQYDFPDPCLHVSPFLYDRRAPEEWLCHAIGGLKVFFPDFLHRSTFFQLRELFYGNLVQLELARYYEYDDEDNSDETITIEEGREALKQLRLTLRSFIWHDVADSAVTPIIFGTSEEIASIVVGPPGGPNASSTTLVASLIETGGPPLLTWHLMLEELTISSDRSTMNLFQALSQVVWSALMHFNLQHQRGQVEFNQVELNGLQQFLHPRTLPSLLGLQFHVSPGPQSAQAVTTIVSHAIQHLFHRDMHKLSVNIISWLDDLIVNEAVMSLVGSPPLECCLRSLSTVVVTDDFTMDWLCAVSDCPHLTSLSIRGKIHPDVNEFNFFHAISPLCVHELELSFFRSAVSSREDDTTNKLRGYLSRMGRSLTTMRLTNLLPEFPSDANSWLGYLDDFPNLTTVSSSFKFARNPSLVFWHVDHDQIAAKKKVKYPPLMLAALARSPSLTSLTLGTLGCTDLEVFNQVWVARIELVSKECGGSRRPEPIVIRLLNLKDLVMTDQLLPHLAQFVEILSRLPCLNDLTLEVCRDGVDHRQLSTAYSYWRDLDRCRSLRQLRLKMDDTYNPGPVTSYFNLTDDIIRQWCRNAVNDPIQPSLIGPNLVNISPSLPPVDISHSSTTASTSNKDTFTQCSSSVVIDGSSTQFPHLELLEIDMSQVSPDSYELLYALPRLRHLHRKGERNPENSSSDVWERIEERNRNCLNQLGGRPPLHIGDHIVTKLDRIKPMKSN